MISSFQCWPFCSLWLSQVLSLAFFSRYHTVFLLIVSNLGNKNQCPVCLTEVELDAIHKGMLFSSKPQKASATYLHAGGTSYFSPELLAIPFNSLKPSSLNRSHCWLLRSLLPGEHNTYQTHTKRRETERKRGNFHAIIKTPLSFS